MGMKYLRLLLVFLLPALIGSASGAIYVENATVFDFGLNAAPAGLSSSLDGVAPRIFTEHVDSLVGKNLIVASGGLNNSLNAVRPRIFTEHVDSVVRENLIVAPVGLNNSMNAVRPRIFTEHLDFLLSPQMFRIDSPKSTFIRISSAASYNYLTKKLLITAYAFDPRSGEITDGSSTYRLTYPDGSTLAQGTLIYTKNEWRTEINLSSYTLNNGIYTIEVSATNNGDTNSDTSTFTISPFTGDIKGTITNTMNASLSGVQVNLYTAIGYYIGELPLVSQVTFSNGTYYFSSINSGSYIITASKTGYLEYISSSFEVQGGMCVQKNIILVSQRNLGYLQNDMILLSDDVFGLMLYENEKIAEISKRAPKDIGQEPSGWDVINAASSVIASSGPLVLTKQVIKMEAERKLYENVFETYLETLVKSTIKGFIAEALLNINGNLVSRDPFWFEDQTPFRTGRENLNLYITNFWDIISLTPLNPNFSEKEGEKIIDDQINQIKQVEDGNIITILPANPENEPIHITLKNNYDGYMLNAAITNFLGSSTKVLSVLSITSMAVAYISTPTGIGAAAAVTVAQSAENLKKCTAIAELLFKAQTALSLESSYIAYANDVIDIPKIYDDTSNLLQKEAVNPYYLNKNNFFTTNVVVDMNPDFEVSGKKFVFTSPIIPFVDNAATITVRNTGNVRSIIRVSGQTFSDFDLPNINIPYIGDIFGGIDSVSWPTGFGYFKQSINSNQEISDNVIYRGYFDPVNLLTPHHLTINVFSGPFLTNTIPENFWTIDPIYILGFTPFSSSELTKSKIASSIKVAASTSEQQLDLNYLARLTPNITRIIDTNVSPATRIIQTNYSVLNTSFLIEFQMFSPITSSVDLHVYDSEGKHVGYNIETGNSSIEFPASYNGREYAPEIIKIPGAANKTYRVVVVLQNPDSNESYPVIVNAIETPLRPSVLGVVPSNIIQKASSGVNTTITLLIGEAGKQKSIQNLTVSISNLTHPNNTLITPEISNANFEIIPAGTQISATFNLTLPNNIPLGNYTGQVFINSSNSGNLTIPVTLEVLTRINSTVTISINMSTLEIGEETNITATVLDDNNTPLVNVPVYFLISNRTIGTLTIEQLTTDLNGNATTLFKAISAGTENLTVIEIGGGNATVNIIIEPKTIPQSITNLSLQALGTTWLNFTWLNPPDPDFSHVMLYLNGTFIDNVSAPQNYYNFTGLNPDTLYELSTHTVDISGNINQTWVNATAKTAPDTITPTPSITVVSPDGGENWARGTIHTIRWTYSGTPGTFVNITLLKSGVFNRTINSSTSIGNNGSGSYAWLINPTQAIGTDYKIMVTSTANPAYNGTSSNNFNIPAASITIVSPNGEESLTRGTTQTIKWNSNGSPGTYVKIELMKSGIFNRTIIASTLNDGSHPWLIPATQAPGTDYKVRITSITNAAYTDTSDNNFTIPTPNISVITPNGGETWRRGTTQTIKWNSSGSPGMYVKIELLKSGILNRVIIASTLNDGSHPWQIPAIQAPGTDYKVRITSTTDVAYNDTSDNSFTIPTPTFTVVSPNGSENWVRGTTKTIRWNSTESPGTYVKIELLKQGVANKVIVSSTLNDGSHPWLIPANQVQGTDYKVKITSTSNASNNDTSDNTFTIPAPSYSVVSPNGSENWTRGTTQTIKWNSTESPGTYVKIELLKPGVANKVIVSSTLNDGSHPWLIPAAQLPGNDYKVKITSTINASVNDTSDNNFSIVLPKIIVTSPNGGENWTQGTAHAITWNYTGNPGTYVKIELLKGGALNRTILSSTLNDKSQGWTIPAAQAPGEDYKIRITSTTNAAYNDTSDSNFNIRVQIP